MSQFKQRKSACASILTILSLINNIQSYNCTIQNQTIDACGDFDKYDEILALGQLQCSENLPVDELNLDGLELNYTNANGFFYVKNGLSTLSAVYVGEPIVITMSYYSTVDLLVLNVLSEDGGPGIVKSVGPSWTTRTLQVKSPGSLILFNLDLRTDFGADFFLLDKLLITFGPPDSSTTTAAESTIITSTLPSSSFIPTTEEPTSTVATTEEPPFTVFTTEEPPFTVFTTEDHTSTVVTTIETSSSQTELPTTPTTKLTTSEFSSTIIISSTISTTDSESTTVPTTTTTADPGCAGCTAEDSYGNTWTACPGSYDIKRCPGESDGVASWLCEATGSFNGSTPDYSNCSSKWLPDIQDIIGDGNLINSTAAGELVQSLMENVLNAQNPAGNLTYFGHEIGTIFSVGQQILVQVDDAVSVPTVENLTADIFSIFKEILSFPGPWEQLSPVEASDSGTKFIAACDNSAISLANRYQNFNNKSTSYRKTFKGITEFVTLSGMQSVKSSETGITFPEFYNPAEDSYIEIPNDWTNYFPEDYIGFAGFELIPEYANKLFPVSSSNSSNKAEKIANGKLMSFTISDSGRHLAGNKSAKVNFKGKGVQISFRHDISAWGSESVQVRRKLHDGERAKAAAGSASCMFWDPVNLDWSSKGCLLVSSDRDRTICECDHLTSFAVIMDLHNYIGKDLGLEILTFILCPMSIICLLICIFVFGYNRHKNQVFSNHPRDDLVLNLCLALLLANVLLLVTTDKNYLNLSDTMCIASAITLHYVFLVAFSWMALEGILLAKLVFLDIFGTGLEHRNIERVAAYLVPAVIVGITCGVNFGRGDHGYGNDSFCWLNENYLWSFVGPVALVCTLNTIVLALCIRKSHALQNNSKAVVKKQARSAIFWIRGSLSLTVIMGLTWIFGFLMLINNSTMANIAAYIFTIFNASQGILIFIFHVALNKKVRQHFTKRDKLVTGTGNMPSSGESKATTIPSSR